MTPWRKPSARDKAMGLASRQQYRNGFLKSEAWRSIRAQSLVRWQMRCFICLWEDFYNDVHHVWYNPAGWEKTGTEHTRVLCRKCHKLVHRFMRSDPLMKYGRPTRNQKNAQRLFNRVVRKIFDLKGAPPETFDQRYAMFNERNPEKLKILDYKARKRALAGSSIRG